MAALSHDLSAEAMHTLLFSRASTGVAVVELKRVTSGGERTQEWHGFEVEDRDGWLLAAETATKHHLRLSVWPLVFSRRILKGVGSTAHNPRLGADLRAYQALVLLRWPSEPAAHVVERHVGVGGHLIRTFSGEHIGVMALDQPRPLGELGHLTRQVAASLGADPCGHRRPLPLPGTRGTAFVTDPALALTQLPVTGDYLIAAGLREGLT